MPPNSDSKKAVHQTYQRKEESWTEKKSQAESSDKDTAATGHWYFNSATEGRGTGRPREEGKDRMTQQEQTLQRLNACFAGDWFW